MGLCVTFVSGLRRCGKSTLIRAMIDQLWKRPPHYIRLVKSGGDKTRPPPSAKPNGDCGVATARWLEYDDERIFELLGETLTALHKQDRYGSVVVEADAEPILRWAYPYDHRVFVMPVPESLGDIFRDPQRAAVELQRVLDDTQAFASEIFGLFSDELMDDGDTHEERSALSKTQLRGFLHSPLGDELATRIQLSPPYHGLVESDLIIINDKVGAPTQDTPTCIRRIERLLDRIRLASGRANQLFHCDPLDFSSSTGKRLLKALKPMCLGGK
ncbi:MAG: hypothetical protein J5J06_08870 [Phycisphaerae bacterium]|nr:hypothetical protein [Phycisphaerae bacterium]